MAKATRAIVPVTPTTPRVVTVPLTALQQADVTHLQAQIAAAQVHLNRLARTVIQGADIDPDALMVGAVSLANPSVGIVVTWPAA